MLQKVIQKKMLKMLKKVFTLLQKNDIIITESRLQKTEINLQ